MTEGTPLMEMWSVRKQCLQVLHVAGISNVRKQEMRERARKLIQH
jgi:hypothetical protein